MINFTNYTTQLKVKERVTPVINCCQYKYTVSPIVKNILCINDVSSKPPLPIKRSKYK